MYNLAIGGDQMKNELARILKIELKNFKNIKNGEIEFMSYKNENFFSQESDIIGIYGQNGSGKTALIEALWILKYTILGESLPDDSKEYIYQGEEEAVIKVVFGLKLREKNYQIFYEMAIKKQGDNSTVISREDLSYKKLENESWSYKRGIISHNIEDKENILSPQQNYNLLTSGNKEKKVDVKVAKELAKNNPIIKIAIIFFIFSSHLLV